MENCKWLSGGQQHGDRLRRKKEHGTEHEQWTKVLTWGMNKAKG